MIGLRRHETSGGVLPRLDGPARNRRTAFVDELFVPAEWFPGGELDPHLTLDALEPLALICQVISEALGDAASALRSDLRCLQQAASRCALEHRSTIYRAGHQLWSILDAVEPLGTLPALARRITGGQLADAIRGCALDSGANEEIDASLLNDLRHRNRSPDPSAVHREAARTQFLSAANGRDLPASLGPWVRDQWLPLAAVIRRRHSPNSAEFAGIGRVLGRLLDNSRLIPWSDPEPVIEMVMSRFAEDLAAASVPDSIRENTTAALGEALRASRPGCHLDITTLDAKPQACLTTLRATQEIHGDAARWRAAFPYGGWFRILDRDSKASRWMTVGVHHPGQSGLRFITLSARGFLDVPRRTLLSDLRYFRCSPVASTAAQDIALDELTRSVTMDCCPFKSFQTIQSS